MNNTKVIEQKLSSMLILLANLTDKVAEVKEILQTSNVDTKAIFDAYNEKVMPKGFVVITAEDFD